jgi:NADH-quinone oxidoreductase subunit L
MYNLAWAVVLLPLGGFLFAFLPESPKRAAQVCVAFTGFAFVVAMVLLAYRLGHAHDNPYQSNLTFWTFDPGQKIQGGFISDYHLQFGVLVDGLSTVMLAVVSFVSLMAQVYATGFMRRDDGYTRNFTTISMATFAMLALVASPNLFGLWVFWEVLGACFYLLTGHWWQRSEAASAARRMFLLTRIGDVALLGGVVWLFAKVSSYVASLPFAPGQPVNDPYNWFTLQKVWPAILAGKVHGSGTRTMVILAVLLVVAAVAKSALLPLHTWMRGVFEEAPAPVLALLSTVTVTAAGVYLLARMYPLLVATPHLLTVVALLGALTAVVGAGCALAQRDIRSILSWSTVSQMGLVFAALGAGAYSAAIFQLVAHAWFKAVLILAATSLVAAYRTSDIDEMGGAWARMRTTSIGLLVGSASAAGVVLLAGFWSVSAITGGVLRNQFPNQGQLGGVPRALVLIAVIATTVAGAVYPMRMFFTVALGELPKRRGFQPQRVREPGGRMTTPVVLLSVVAAVFGLFGIPKVHASFGNFVFAGASPEGSSDALTGLAITAVAALLGVAVAWLLHTRQLRAPKFGRLGSALQDGLGVEGAYDWAAEHALVQPSPLLGRFDRQVGRLVLDEVGAGVAAAAEAGRRWQVGRVDAVTLSAVAGVVVVAGAVVLGATGHLPWLGGTR